MLKDIPTTALRDRLHDLNTSPSLKTWDERALIVNELIVRQIETRSIGVTK